MFNTVSGSCFTPEKHNAEIVQACRQRETGDYEWIHAPRIDQIVRDMWLAVVGIECLRTQA